MGNTLVREGVGELVELCTVLVGKEGWVCVGKHNHQPGQELLVTLGVFLVGAPSLID